MKPVPSVVALECRLAASRGRHLPDGTDIEEHAARPRQDLRRYTQSYTLVSQSYTLVSETFP